MHTLTIDFETYYARDYSLSKRDITTESYIRDPRFEVIGCAVKHNGHAAHWHSGNHYDMEQWLNQFSWSTSAVISHNAMFDMAILSWHFGIRPHFIVDTLSMARRVVTGKRHSLKALAEHFQLGVKGEEVIQAVGLRREQFPPQQLAQYGRYCCNDANLTYDLWKVLRPLTPNKELRLIDETIRMFSEPRLRLDLDLLSTHLKQVQYNKQVLLDSLSTTEDAKDLLMSNQKFAAALLGLGVTPPMKTSPTTGKEVYAFAKTDKDFQALLEHDDPQVQTLVAARLGVKSTIEETRTQSLIEIGERGLLPMPLVYYGAMTGRWSGTQKVNMQNMPRGGTIRRAIRALPGHALVVCDSANIELRVAHTLAGQQTSVAAFRDQRDLYCEFASVIFKRTITKADKYERTLGKLAMLSLQYGAGAPKFQEMCRRDHSHIVLTDEEAKNIVTLWRNTFSEIPRLWRDADATLTRLLQTHVVTPVGADGIVTTGQIDTDLGFVLPEGRSIRYPDLQQSDSGLSYFAGNGKRKYLWGGILVENLCQSLARHIIADQWLWIAQWFKQNAPQWRVVLQVHDEIVAAGPKSEAGAVLEVVTKLMSTAPAWWSNIPLGAEGAVADRYGDAK